MSCGTCSEKTKQGAASAIGAPAATGVAVRKNDKQPDEGGVGGAEVIAATVIWVQAHSTEEVAGYIVNLRAAIDGAMTNVNSYREAYVKLYRELHPEQGESQDFACKVGQEE